MKTKTGLLVLIQTLIVFRLLGMLLGYLYEEILQYNMELSTKGWISLARVFNNVFRLISISEIAIFIVLMILLMKTKEESLHACKQEIPEKKIRHEPLIPKKPREPLLSKEQKKTLKKAILIGYGIFAIILIAYFTIQILRGGV